MYLMLPLFLVPQGNMGIYIYIYITDELMIYG